MTPYYLLFACFLIGLAIPLIPGDRFRASLLWWFVVLVLLIVTFFAGLRSSHVDRDYGGYETWFTQIRGGWIQGDVAYKDPAFGLIALTAASFGLQYLSVALVYAFMAGLAQAIFSFAVNSERYISLYLYLVLCRFFVLLNMTQIRAGVAIPLMSLAIYLICTRRRATGSLLYLIALMFHLSVAIAAPVIILILCGVRFQSRKWVLAFIPLIAVAAMFLGSFLANITYLYRLGQYLHGATEEEQLSLLSFHFILHVSIIAIAFAFFWSKLNMFERVAVFASSWGCFLYAVLLANASLAARLEEVLDLFWLFLVIIIIRKLPPKWHLAYLALAGVFGFIMFQSTIGVVKPYGWWDSAF